MTKIPKYMCVMYERRICIFHITECSKDEFQCDDGFCIDRKLLCDNKPDCIDKTLRFETIEKKGPKYPPPCLKNFCLGGKNFWDESDYECIQRSKLICPETMNIICTKVLYFAHC